MNQRHQSFGLQSAQIECEYDIVKFLIQSYNNKPFNKTPSCSPLPQNEAEQNDDLNFSINSNTNFQAQGFKTIKNQDRSQMIKIQSKLFEVLKVDKLVAIFKEKLMLKSHVLSQAKREKIKKIISEKYLQKRISITQPEFNKVNQSLFLLYLLLQIKSSTFRLRYIQEKNITYNAFLQIWSYISKLVQYLTIYK